MQRYVYKYFSIAFIFLIIMKPTTSNSISEFCSSLLPKDYKLFESPDRDMPVNVYNSFQVLDIGEINEEKMDYLLHVFIITVWKDSRIKPNASKEMKIPSVLPMECLTHLWKPDIFFETAKSVETFRSSAPAIILKVYSDSTISLNIRYLFRCSCHMKFHNYPFDSQICQFYVALISPDTEAILCWSDEEGSLFPDSDPVIAVLRSIEPLQYSLGGIKTRKIVDVLPDANYTTLVADFIFDRRLIGSVINTYIPSTLIVFMSWFGFWLGLEAVPARVALSITSLLTLCTQVQQYQSQLPTVNYIKAMDIWLFVCIFLVFSTLLEFSIAYNVDKAKKRKRQEMHNNVQVQTHSNHVCRSRSSKCNHKDRLFRRSSNESADKSLDVKIQSKLYTMCNRMWTKMSDQGVDGFCQKLYPAFFVVFAIFYWTYYLNIYYNNR